MKSTLRKLTVFLICISTMVSVAFAASVPVQEESSLLVILFVGFFALIIVLQLVPACMLFLGILKGLFSPIPKIEEKKITYK